MEKYAKLKDVLKKRLNIVSVLDTKVTLAKGLGESFYDKKTNKFTALFRKPVFTLDCEYGTFWAHTPKAYHVIENSASELSLTKIRIFKDYQEKKF